LRILYIHQYFSTYADGFGTRALEFARLLARNGHDVVLLSGPLVGQRRSRRSRHEGFTLVRVGLPYNRRWGLTARILSYIVFAVLATLAGLFLGGFDVIVATSTPLTVGIPGVLLSKLKRAPLVFEVRDLWPDVPVKLGLIKSGLLSRTLYALESWVYRNSTRVIGLSPSVVSLLEEEKSVDHQRTALVPNCSNLELFGSHVKAKDWSDLGFESEFTCIYSGSMGFANGTDFILRLAYAYKQLAADWREVSFVLIGDGAERHRLEKLKAEWRLDNVYFVDCVPKTVLGSLLAGAQLCLMTVAPYKVLEHNCANKFFDYLAAGKPIVMNFRGWMWQYCKQYRCGLYLPPNKPEVVVGVINRLKRRPDILQRMGSNARLLAEREFSVQMLGERFLRVLVDASRES